LTPSPNVIFLHNHVAQIDADAKLHPSRRRDISVASCHPPLDFGSAQHRVGDAVELEQHAVAGGLDDAAAVFGDGRIDELDPMGFEARERPCLVDLHQPTITHHISCDDCCEPALWFGHAISPLSSRSSLTDDRLEPKLGSSEQAAPN
jgi:hypothetical protein